MFRQRFYRRYSIEQFDVIVHDFVFVVIQYALKLPSVVINKLFTTGIILLCSGYSSVSDGSGCNVLQ